MVTHPRSYSGATAPSNVPNSESIPSNTSIMKNKTAHKGDTSRRRKASQYVMNANPGPDPTCILEEMRRDELGDMSVLSHDSRGGDRT